MCLRGFSALCLCWLLCNSHHVSWFVRLHFSGTTLSLSLWVCVCVWYAPLLFGKPREPVYLHGTELFRNCGKTSDEFECSFHTFPIRAAVVGLSRLSTCVQELLSLQLTHLRRTAAVHVVHAIVRCSVGPTAVGFHAYCLARVLDETARPLPAQQPGFAGSRDLCRTPPLRMCTCCNSSI